MARNCRRVRPACPSRRRAGSPEPSLLVLSIDTCLDACQAALLDADEVRFSRSEPMHRGHQERLAPMVAEAMAAAGVRMQSVRRIGVTVGPGSFTGLRVGLAFAKGLAIALGVPCVGVTTLEALAASVATPQVLAAVDARRGQAYLQLFAGGAAAGPAEAVPLDEAAAWIAARRGPGPLAVAGSGARLLEGLAPELRIVPLQAPDPAAVGRLALKAAEPSAPPRPVYLRAPDARLPS